MPTARPMPAKPHMLRAGVTAGRPVRVDTKAEVIHGYALAQEGPFKSAGRGEFDRKALRMIVDQVNAERKGLRSRFTHPSMSSDGLGKFLGRTVPRSAWLDQSGPVWIARADLQISPSSHDTPSGDLGGYVLRLAAEDPDALSSSLVIEPDEEYRLNPDGTPVRGDDGEALPPLWFPKRLYATDVVDTGDAVDGILSAGGASLSVDDLPDALQRRGWEMLDRLFAGQSADVVRQRCHDYVNRYCAARGLAPTVVIIPTVEKPKAVLAPSVEIISTVPKPTPTVIKMITVAPDRPNRAKAGRIISRIARP